MHRIGLVVSLRKDMYSLAIRALRENKLLNEAIDKAVSLGTKIDPNADPEYVHRRSIFFSYAVFIWFCQMILSILVGVYLVSDIGSL